MNDFPKAINVVDSKHEKFKIICLLKRQESDIMNPQKFNEVLKELQPYYEEIYIIDEAEGWKINLIGNPTRLYVDKNQVVTHIGFGIALFDDFLINEIENSEVVCSTYGQWLETTISWVSDTNGATSR